MDWEVKIKKVDNGYIFEYPDTLCDDTTVNVQELFEIKHLTGDNINFKTQCEDKQTLGNLLYRVAEHFGNRYDGFSKENLKITFDLAGDEVE